jgi:phosphopantetheinyl transferase (holo-ACP synthase)
MGQSQSAKLMWRTADHLLEPYGLRYSLSVATLRADTPGLVKEAVTRLFVADGRKFFGIDVSHDSSGVPCVAVYDRDGSPLCAPCVTTTHTALLNACLAVSLPVHSTVCGVGIDSLELKDAEGLRAVSPRRFAWLFSEKEAAFISAASEDEALRRMARLFCAKEAAFKSMSMVYALYRARNGGHALPVSFTDFEFSAEDSEAMTVSMRGMTADICSGESLRILVRASSDDESGCAVALCFYNCGTFNKKIFRSAL